MMLTINELQKRWDHMPIFESGFMRIDSEHPLEICIGYDELNQKTLQIIDTGEVETLPSSKSISANNFKRIDGKWAIAFRLIRKETEDVFIHLCWDIIESSREETNDNLNYVLERFMKWIRLMEHVNPDIMNGSRIKGLIGELFYLQEFILKYGSSKAVNSWSGPDGADQDFIFDDTWVEVKSVALASESVSISSLEQLDSDKEGFLVLYYIDKTTPEDSLGFTLINKIIETRNLLMNDLKAQELFELKLFQYGFKDNKAYDQQRYKSFGKNTYLVAKAFPKLIKASVPYQIVSAKYNLSLSAIEDYKC